MPCAQNRSLAEDSEQLTVMRQRMQGSHTSSQPVPGKQPISGYYNQVWSCCWFAYIRILSVGPLHSWNVTPPPEGQYCTVQYQYKHHKSNRYPETSPTDLADIIAYVLRKQRHPLCLSPDQWLARSWRGRCSRPGQSRGRG